MIVYASWTEPSLHEPMYILMCNMMVNVMFGSCSFLPKLTVDLLSGHSVISLSECLAQAFCIQNFACLDLLSFSFMAYDRFLAVHHPLRYNTMMTNGKAFKIVATSWSLLSIVMILMILLTERLIFCGRNIDNAFCETMSLVHLACGDTSALNILGSILTFSLFISCLVFIVYCYIGTLIICLRIPLEARKKAMHTLATHMMAFSLSMSACVFVVFRYRFNFGTFSNVAQIVFAASGLMFCLIVNPLIYGIRIEALRSKIIQNLQKIYSKT
ncbi:olfactory receptor 10H4-like [Phyllobates terribilis]|uniref:olfactory receptor 10H4-like n=1 Tax=Phyllobates terribilis TaxID=111132 RepID=UPI003CCAFA95